MGFLDFLRSLWRGFAPRRSESVTGAVAAPEGGARVDDPALAAGPADDPAEEPAGADDDLDLAIGAAFDSALGGAREGGREPAAPFDNSAARELFAHIASNFSRPVKNFIFELKRGTATKDWIEICQPVMSSIIDGAESLELQDVAQRMVNLREALSLAQAGEGRQLDDDSRELILSCYDELIEALPETFMLGTEDRRRESILIHSLLRQIPEVGHVTLDKLYGAGLTSLDALFLANKADLAVASGVPEWLCERICDKVRDHRERLEHESPEAAEVDQRARLNELIKELRRQQESFQEISDEDRSTPELAAAKRDCLRNRRACALQVNVLLAEMGRVDLVEELRTLGIERRIERLEQYAASIPASLDTELRFEVTSPVPTIQPTR